MYGPGGYNRLPAMADKYLMYRPLFGSDLKSSMTNRMINWLDFNRDNFRRGQLYNLRR